VQAVGPASAVLLTTTGRLLLAPVGAEEAAAGLGFGLGEGGGAEARVRGWVSALADVGSCERRVEQRALLLRAQVTPSLTLSVSE
jgi:hypothetical protein